MIVATQSIIRLGYDMGLYINSNSDIFAEICQRNNWNYGYMLGVVYNSPIERIDRRTGKYYLLDSTEHDIPQDIVLT